MTDRRQHDHGRRCTDPLSDAMRVQIAAVDDRLTRAYAYQDRLRDQRDEMAKAAQSAMTDVRGLEAKLAEMCESLSRGSNNMKRASAMLDRQANEIDRLRRLVRKQQDLIEGRVEVRPVAAGMLN